MPETRVPGGAYGLTVEGVPDARSLLVDAPPHWPPMNVSTTKLGRPPGAETIDDAHAVVRLGSGGWVTIDRLARQATFAMPSVPSSLALVHPHLAAVAAVEAHWTGRESFHAGGFVVAGGVWGLMGLKGAGKSSMLAALAVHGIPVMSDDVLVVEGRTALAGPRSVDLRAGAVAHLGGAQNLGLVGGRERWRVSIGAVSPELPLHGWVELHWGETFAVRAKRGSDRLRGLIPHRALRVRPMRPEQLVHLAALPVLELHRPRRWSSHEQAIETLLDAIGNGGEPSRLQKGE